MKIAILDYTTKSVDIIQIHKEFADTESIEEYLNSELGYDLDAIYYMTGDNIEVNNMEFY